MRRAGGKSSMWMQQGIMRARYSRQKARKGKKGSRMMGAQKGQSWQPDIGSAPRPIWPSEEPTTRILWRLYTILQETKERFQ
jgi:hypothetical protein